MMVYQVTSDASDLYRETSSAQTMTTNSAADVGNMAQLIRDSSVRMSSPTPIGRITVKEPVIISYDEF